MSLLTGRFIRLCQEAEPKHFVLPLRSRKTDHDVVQFFPPLQVGSTSSQSRASRNARQCQSVFRCTPHRQPQTRRAESLRYNSAHCLCRAGGGTEQHCITPRRVPEPDGQLSLAPTSVRPAPAAAYGLAPNSTGNLMNARFSLGANFNLITRPKDAAGYIYLFFGRSRATARQLSYVIH